MYRRFEDFWITPSKDEDWEKDWGPPEPVEFARPFVRLWFVSLTSFVVCLYFLAPYSAAFALGVSELFRVIKKRLVLRSRALQVAPEPQYLLSAIITLAPRVILIWIFLGYLLMRWMDFNY